MYVHEKMSKVVYEQLVVHMVVCRGAQPHPGEPPVPGMLVLGVNQTKPVRVQGSEGHVGPHVRRYDSGRHDQGDENHEEGVTGRAVESIEELWICKPMVPTNAILPVVTTLCKYVYKQCCMYA